MTEGSTATGAVLTDAASAARSGGHVHRDCDAGPVRPEWSAVMSERSGTGADLTHASSVGVLGRRGMFAGAAESIEYAVKGVQ